MSIRNLKLEVILGAIDKATRPIKAVMGSSQGLSKQLQDTKARLKELNAQQSKIDGFVKMRNDAAEAYRAAKKVREEASASFNAAKKNATELAKSFHEAQARAAPMVEKFNAENQRIQELRAKQLALQKEFKAQEKAVIAARSALSKHDNAADRSNLRAMEAQLAGLRTRHRESGRTLYTARRENNELRQDMKGLVETAKEVEKQFEAAKRTSKKLKDTYNAQTEAVLNLRRSMQEAGKQVKEASQGQADLKQRIQATSQAMEDQRSKLAKLAARQAQQHAARARYDKGLQTRDRVAGAGAGMMAAGATTGAAVTVPISAYAQAEDAAMQLRVSMMEKGGKVKREYADIVALAERLGNRLPGTTADFQEMMTTLNRQGMSTKAILGGVGEASAYLGVQLKLPYSQAAEYAAKMQDATGALEKDMMGVMDTIQRTYQVGVDPSNMVSGFAKLAPVLDMIKQKGLAGAQTMAPLLAMADQASLVGESAGNAYRKVFQRSMDAKKVSKGNALAKSTGIKLDFTNGKGEFGGLDKMFNQLAQLKKLNTQQRNDVIAEIWGDDAETLQALNVMIDKGQAGYNEMQQKMANQAALQERVNAQLGTLKNLWDAASGTFTNAMVRFGEAIAPELKALTEWIANISERLGNWAKENPALANTLMKIAGITAIALTALGGLAVGIAGVIGPIIAFRFALSMLGIRLGSLLPDIGAARGALTRLPPLFSSGAAGARVYATAIASRLSPLLGVLASRAKALALSNWGLGLPIKLAGGLGRGLARLLPLLSGIVQFGSGIMQAFLGPLRVLGLLTRLIPLLGAAIGATPIGWLIAALTAGALLIYKFWGPLKGFIVGFIGGLASGLGSVLGPAFAARWGVLGKLWNQLKTLGSYLLQLLPFLTPIGAALMLAFQPVKELIGWLWNGLTSLLKPMQDTGGAAQNMGQRIGSAVGQIIGWVASLPVRMAQFGVYMVQGLIGGINSMLGSLKSTVMGMADSVVKLFKEKLGIHSPSRVFAELGGFTMAGLSGGLEKGSAGPLAAIKDFAGQLIERAKAIVLPAPAVAPQDEDRAITRQRVLAEPPPLLQRITAALPEIKLPDVAGQLIERAKAIVLPAPAVAPQDETRAITRQRVLAEPPPLLQRIKAVLPEIDLPTPDLGGIKNGFSLDTLRDMVGKITAAGAGLAIGTATAAPVPIDTRPPISAARPAPAASTPAQINITINAAPGMNEQQLAQLVARELARAQQQQAARSRSRLTDKD